MHLIDKYHPGKGIVVDEADLDTLARAVIGQHFPEWDSEAAAEAHAYHDGPAEPNCAHCRIDRYHRGQGAVVARALFAVTVLRADGPGAGRAGQPEVASGVGVAAREAIEALAALEQGNTTWWDLGGHMTCAEAEAVAHFFRVVGHEEVAADVLDGHAENDQEGDAHWLGPFTV